MRFRMAITATTLLLAGLLVATVVAGPGSFQSAKSETALELMTIVNGTVYDTGKLPVVGAEVNVSMYDGATLRSYETDTSDSEGGYSVTFGGLGGPEWAVGDTIVVIASDGVCTGENSTVAIDHFKQSVNVTLSTVIPEFGDLGTLLPIAGVLGMFMAFFFVRRERKT